MLIVVDLRIIHDLSQHGHEVDHNVPLIIKGVEPLVELMVKPRLVSDLHIRKADLVIKIEEVKQGESLSLIQGQFHPGGNLNPHVYCEAADIYRG